MRTIFRECVTRKGYTGKLYGVSIPGRCEHKHWTPGAAAKCKHTHAAAAPKGMWSTAVIMASDDNGANWRPLTNGESADMFDAAAW